MPVLSALRVECPVFIAYRVYRLIVRIDTLRSSTEFKGCPDTEKMGEIKQRDYWVDYWVDWPFVLVFWFWRKFPVRFCE